MTGFRDRSPPLVCGNCDFFEPHPEATAEQRRRAGQVHEGFCRRAPGPYAKRAEDWCGEHSILDAERAQRQADMVAARLAERGH
jgi:hypothetical protein